MLSKLSSHQDIFQEISRKMKYGAPELKKYYGRFLMRGLMTAVAIAAVLSVSVLQHYISEGYKSKSDEIITERVISIIEATSAAPIQIKETPVINKKITIKDLSALKPEPVTSEEMTESIKLKNQAELENVKLPVSSKGLNEPGSLTDSNSHLKFVNLKNEESKSTDKNSDKQFEQFQVERFPTAKNLSSIKESVNYPESARKNGIEGRVVARILIGKNGSVIKIGELSGPEAFYSEVSEKIMDLKFNPAFQNNEKVNCWVNVPFNFRLINESSGNLSEEEQ